MLLRMIGQIKVSGHRFRCVLVVFLYVAKVFSESENQIQVLGSHPLLRSQLSIESINKLTVSKIPKLKLPLTGHLCEAVTTTCHCPDEGFPIIDFTPTQNLIQCSLAKCFRKSNDREIENKDRFRYSNTLSIVIVLM